MNPYLSEKARGEIPRVLKWLRNAGLAFCVFCSFGGLYTSVWTCRPRTLHVGGYVLWIVVGAVPLVLFARNEKRRYHARTIARRVESYSGPEVLCGGCTTALVWTQRTLHGILKTAILQTSRWI
mgnify:CR=1 FL=1